MNKVKSARVLLLDIETSPIVGYTWGTYDTSVLKVIEPSKILSVSWKWLNEEETYCKAICDYKGYKKGVVDDEKLIKEVWKLLDQADICIAHHGKKFDFPKLNARFIYYGLKAPSSYQVIDTRQVAASKFKFDSNSLNNLGTYLGLGNKIHNGGFSTWTECIDGNQEAWQLMKDYNVQDVILLEKVYLALRPYMTNHPSLSLISGSSDGSNCPTCQSTSVMRRGFSYTRTGRKQRYQCSDCGSWSSGPFEKVKTSSLLFSDEE